MSDRDITEENGKIKYTETENHDEKTLIQRYKKEWTDRQMLKKQLDNIPKQREQLKAEREINNNFIERLDKDLNKIKGILEKEINIKNQLEKIRNNYSEKELMKKSNEIYLKSHTEIKKENGVYKRVKTFENDQEDLLIYYESLHRNRINYVEKQAEIEQNLEKLENTKIRIENTLNEIDDSMNATENFFKKKGKDFNQVLSKYSNSKTNKDVGEISA